MCVSFPVLDISHIQALFYSLNSYSCFSLNSPHFSLFFRSGYVALPRGLPQNATVTVTALKWRDWQGVELDRREVAQAY